MEKFLPGEEEKPFYAPAIEHPQCRAMGGNVAPDGGGSSVCRQKQASQ